MRLRRSPWWCAPLAWTAANWSSRAAEKLYADLLALGVDVILDDRGERPGAMFADWELIGVPHRVVLGDRGLKEGLVEYQHRRDARRHPRAAGRRGGTTRKPGWAVTLRKGSMALWSRRHCLLAAAAWAALAQLPAQAGAQIEEPLIDSVRSALQAAVNDLSPPEPIFASTDSRLQYLRWLTRHQRQAAQAHARLGGAPRFFTNPVV